MWETIRAWILAFLESCVKRGGRDAETQSEVSYVHNFRVDRSDRL